jgi:hypothetical protein
LQSLGTFLLNRYLDVLLVVVLDEEGEQERGEVEACKNEETGFKTFVFAGFLDQNGPGEILDDAGCLIACLPRLNPKKTM